MMAEVFLGGELFIEAGGLEDDADIFAHAIALRREVEFQDADDAGAIDGNERGKQPEERGFAAAVRTEETEDFAPANDEFQVDQRGALAVQVAEVIDIDNDFV